MGKLKQNDSDNEMDVEVDNNNGMDVENATKVAKKNKKISKAKATPSNQLKTAAARKISPNNIIKQAAKLVNLKRSQKSLQQKQELFKTVVKGLRGDKTSKKDRKKSRILLKKELHKALTNQAKPQPKAAFSTMQSEKSFVQKKKKQPINQKQEVIKIRSAMGQSISSLKSMIAQKLQQ